MNTRRSFLSLLTAGSFFRTSADKQQRKQQPSFSTLQQRSTPLSRAEALHLLRRITFAPTPTLVEQLIGKTPAEAVTLLLGDDSPVQLPTPGNWIQDQTENPLGADLQTRFAIQGQWRNWFGALQTWWVARMAGETLPAAEKLTLFWSGHFTSEFDFDDTFNLPQLLYKQNQTFRKDRLGDFRTMVEDITLDGAMLVYLGGTLNVKGKPNENFARELLELYTTGLGGRYTEGDIQEAARVLTGWRAQRFNDEPAPNGMYNTYFVSSAHDTGKKEFLGKTIPARDQDSNTEFLVRRDEVRRLINIIFEERPLELSEFICRKIYTFFVYLKPSAADSTVITQMAEVFRRENFTIRPVLEALLTSEHFYDIANRGVQIKTPAEFAVGLIRQLQIAAPGTVASAMATFEQDIMDPPNVAGWEGYRTWISTKTYPLRTRFGEQVIDSASAAALVAMVKTMPDYMDITSCTRALAEYFLPVELSAERLAYYQTVLLQGAPDYEWGEIISTDQQAAALRIRALLKTFLRAPDMHLC